MGLKLYRTFLDAGLPEPALRAQSSVHKGSDVAVAELWATNIRSFLPVLERSGIATAEEVEVDTLAERLRQELSANRAVVVAPPFIDAWARKP
jgi:hypothetical protein